MGSQKKSYLHFDDAVQILKLRTEQKSSTKQSPISDWIKMAEPLFGKNLEIVKSTAQSLGTEIKRHPKQSMVIAVGIGAIAGFAIARVLDKGEPQ